MLEARIGNDRKLKETIIRINQPGNSFASSVKLGPSLHRLNSKSLTDHSAVLRKKTHRIRFSAITSYVAIAALVVSILAVGYQPPVQRGASTDTLSRASISIEKPSVDQVAAAELAAEVAQAADLSVATNVVNLSISLSAKSQLAQTDDTLLSKPQIVQASSGRGIQEYISVQGDTVQSLSQRFGISENSIRWSNGLSSDAIEAGKHLFIPGVSGVVYVVRDGDSLASIAERFKADADRIVIYNDAELSGLQVGQRIVIPDGVQPVAAVTSRVSFSYGWAGGSVGNRYDYGYCTWYAYERRAAIGRPVGSFWGNATSWAGFAAASGYAVNNTPAVGAVMQSSGGWGGYGHVAVVEQVYPDGSIRISEMNYAGWNVVSSRTLSASQAASYNYIH